MKKNLLKVFTPVMCAIMLAGCSFTASDVEEEVSHILEYQSGGENAGEEKEEPEDEVQAVGSTTAQDKEKEKEKEKEEPVEEVQIEEPDAQAMTEEHLDIDTENMTPAEADNTGNDETAVEEQKPDTLQIVFLGDSIFDSVRDETGIAHIVGDQLGADIYNLSVGGTTAALTKVKGSSMDNWSEPSLMGVIYTMEGKLKTDVMDGYKAGEVIKTLDPSKTDYFIIQYGTNDFLSYIPLGAPDVNGQYHYYFSTALEMAVDELRANYPKAQIIFCTPYYEHYWSADRTRFIGDSNIVNNGYGIFLDYIGTVIAVADDKGIPCLNMLELMGIDTYTVEKMTVDGIHPNQEARNKYAWILIDKINELEAQKSEKD